MSEERNPQPDPSLIHILEPDEELHVQAQAVEGIFAVTNRRLVVTKEGRITLDVAYSEMRRIQFDIERDRPATVVIVPESATKSPDVLSIPVDQYETVARALAIVGQGLAAAVARPWA
jgi:hypothetical protein